MKHTDPLTQTQFEALLEKLHAQREQLLGVIRPLSHTMRNWKPNDDQLNIHEILMHIGIQECEWVSKLGQTVSAPSEVTLMRYLHQSREVVLARLQQLSEAQLAETFADGWDVPRVLAQILTHEAAQIEQIESILAQWRLHLLARLAAERAGLFATLLGLSEAQLTEAEPMPGWTVKDLLAHVAFWDGFHTNRMQMVADGRSHEIMEIGDDDDMAAFNERLLAEQKAMPLEQAIAMLLKERSGFLQTLKRLSDADLQSQVRLPWGWRTYMRVWARWRYQHDAEHAQQIQAWRDTLPPDEKRNVGPKYVLRALLKACRKEFLALLPLLPEAEWSSRPVCGVWTMKDLMGHLTAWADVGGQAVNQVLAGQTPSHAPIADFNAWNMDQAAQRADLPWETIWAAYEKSYQVLLDGLDNVSDAQLAQQFATPWNSQISVYRWLAIWPLHEREHAIDVRHALNLTRWPKRFTEHPAP
ncbi:MAG: DinB family protein [Ardenticatenaceae bacterium]|nr:DinB family protein [Ardenticatenaceae bacterium]